MAEVTGKVVQILGGVVDCEFPAGELPQVYDAIELDRPGQAPLILEVQRHLGHRQVRTVAMDTTDGLQRGMPARTVGGPITVPVGEASLGRVFNVLG
ncbi:MAG TPA: F0F1 ATP synthase subunit beta, partial [Anaerolineales bacterium]|nr:F0F1 ATP synthase subunit beta [Anaerolineales bacterium]